MKKEKKYNEISSADKAALVCEWLDEKQGDNIVTLDVGGLCSITEYICVVSARSLKQGQALADHLLDKCKEEHIEFLGMEGYKPGDWVLVDLNDVIVHVFQSELRDFYNIEGMWSEAQRNDFCGEGPRE